MTVSTPSVGRPQPPASVQAALSRMAFTPYAALGQSNNDGLAPNESGYALAQACMSAAGYPGAGNVPFAVRSARRTWRSRSPGGPGAISAPPRRSSTASGSARLAR